MSFSSGRGCWTSAAPRCRRCPPTISSSPRSSPAARRLGHRAGTRPASRRWRRRRPSGSSRSAARCCTTCGRRWMLDGGALGDPIRLHARRNHLQRFAGQPARPRVRAVLPGHPPLRHGRWLYRARIRTGAHRSAQRPPGRQRICREGRRLHRGPPRRQRRRVRGARLGAAAGDPARRRHQAGSDRHRRHDTCGPGRAGLPACTTGETLPPLQSVLFDVAALYLARSKDRRERKAYRDEPIFRGARTTTPSTCKVTLCGSRSTVLTSRLIYRIMTDDMRPISIQSPPLVESTSPVITLRNTL